MKKCTLFFSLFFLCIGLTYAQNSKKRTIKLLPKYTESVEQNSTGSDENSSVKSSRNCNTIEHMQWIFEQDPSLKAKMETEEKKFNNYISVHEKELKNNKTSYTIPVVIHVVYKNTSTGYVDPSRVIEQLDRTNSDWAGLSTHSMGPFPDSLKANSNITFCLASVDPDGNPTTGIIYKQTTVTSFSANDNVKHSSTGGDNAWDPTKYLNIWVCNLGSGMCGYQFPTSGINPTYGVVIHYQFFGITGAVAPYNQGRAMTHEMGHCFNLFHLIGDSSCTDADGCLDTPSEYGSTSTIAGGCVIDLCTDTYPGIMYMNFMSYSDDTTMANFTPDQVAIRVKLSHHFFIFFHCV